MARNPVQFQKGLSLGAFLAATPDAAKLAPALREAAVVMLTERKLDREVQSTPEALDVTGLLGQHPRIHDRVLALRLDEFLERVGEFMRVRVPGFREFRRLRQQLIDREKQRLRVDEFMPRVLTSFVRNKLVSEVYLPLVGANMAKQLGAAGDQKRTDRMGMLLLISPPGYGKTTLMEYVANRLGLVFMKINGPALGHEVVSIDPADAPNATARQEVEKVNLALEMGNNVMLYLDDIQHTNPEFLQSPAQVAVTPDRGALVVALREPAEDEVPRDAEEERARLERARDPDRRRAACGGQSL